MLVRRSVGEGVLPFVAYGEARCGEVRTAARDFVLDHRDARHRVDIERHAELGREAIRELVLGAFGAARAEVIG